MKTIKTVKQGMESDNWKVKNIIAKGSKKIRVDFEQRFGVKRQSFWIDRDYFQKNYPETYDRF
jgi:hypothetical protein